jgi:hypothetical protein
MIRLEGYRKPLFVPLVGPYLRFLIGGGVVHGLVIRHRDFVPVGFWYGFFLKWGMASCSLVHSVLGQKFEAIIKLN